VGILTTDGRAPALLDTDATAGTRISKTSCDFATSYKWSYPASVDGQWIENTDLTSGSLS